MNSDLHVAIVFGGSSPEASVSRVSGKGVATALRQTFAMVSEWELDHDLPARLLAAMPDVCFPMLHGGVGEDGNLQGCLEILGISYVGSGVAACAAAMNKWHAKQLFLASRIPVADDCVCSRHDDRRTVAAAAAARFPEGCVVKPVGLGSALGISFARTPGEISAALSATLALDKMALVERRIFGREITVAVLEDPELRALPVVEIATPHGSWYDYQHRYTAGTSTHFCPARLPAEVMGRAMELGVAAHRALGCRDLSRVDMLVDDNGKITVLEVNTIPGMTPTSLFPDAARAAGISFEALFRGLVLRAASRQIG